MTFAGETLELAAEGAAAYGRRDLARRLGDARHLLDDVVTVFVVGEFKQGKSSLINGLVSREVCPVDDDIATSVLTRVGHAATTSVEASYETSAGTDRTPWSESVPIEQVARYVTENGNPGNHRNLRSLAIGVDSEFLRGLVLVDTPGVGGLGSVHGAATVGALPRAHAVAFVSDASQELSAAEVRFLRTVGELCPTLFLVLSKIDLHPGWEAVRDADLRHLRDAGVRCEVYPVSSTLRGLALEGVDEEADAESGFGPLFDRFAAITRDAERVTLRAVGHHVLSVADQLEPVLRSRADALASPERAADLVAELTRARERADALRDRASGWQQTLNDGFSDLSSDVEYDLRRRARAIVRDAEKAIDEGDPALDWPGFEQWLRQRAAAEAMENHAMFVGRARGLAERIGEEFELAADAALLPTRGLAGVGDVGDIEMDATFRTPRKRFAGGMAGFQKAYGGFMMVTLLGHMASLALPGPVGIGLGLLLGRQGFKEERNRQVERRRAEAKAGVRRFVDEFTARVGKDSRDGIRQVQREMRDGYATRVDELRRSTADALTEAERAHADGAQQAEELERLGSDLERIARLRERAVEIVVHADRPALGRTAR